MKKLKTMVGLIGLVAFSVAATQAQKLTSEAIIAKHLESIGTVDVRASTKSLIAVGPGTGRFTSTADIPVNGRIVIASEGNKIFLGMNMESPQYPGERFLFDGKDASAAAISYNKRSFLGNFVQDNGVLLKAGIFGGVYSTGWLFSSGAAEKGKLSFEDTKKIDKKPAYAIKFSPKGGSDVTITLYFDAETFRHIRTEYKRMTSAPMGVMSQRDARGVSSDNSGRQQETRIELTEDYSDFKTEKGLTLPQGYKISYSYSGNGGTVQAEWKFTVNEIAVNPKLDAATFVRAN